MAFDQLIRVGITGDGVQLASALNVASGQIEGFARRATSSLARIGALFGGLSVVGLTAGVKSAIDAFDEMNKAAQKTGTSVRTLSALRYAAEQADVPFETLQKGLQKFAKTLDAARDGSKDATQALQALGVSSRSDLKEGLLGIADAFAKMPDGARKVALSLQLFGKAGAELIPFLNQGRDGIEGLMAEAEALGIVMDEKTAQAAEKFNDSLNTVSKSATAVGYALANQLLPGLSGVAKGMGEAAVAGKGFLGIVNALAEGVTRWSFFGSGKEGLESELDATEAALSRARAKADQLKRQMKGEEDRSVLDYLFNAFGPSSAQEIDSIAKSTNGLSADVTRLRGELLQLALAEDKAAGSGGSLDDALEANRAAAEEAAKSLAGYKKLIDELQQGQRSANANPILKTGSSVLDINRLKDLAQSSLQGGDARTALEYINKARQINEALLAAGQITKGYYQTQAQQLLELAQAGQKVVDGEPIKVPVAPDLASAVAAGQLAWAAAQQGAVANGPVIIPGVVQLSGNSFGQAAAPSQSYQDLMAQFMQQNPGWTPQYAGGGVVSGPGTGTSDSILARLSKGEFVMPAWVTDRMRSTLEYMRSFGRLPKFAAGGAVGGGSERFSIQLGGGSYTAQIAPDAGAALRRELRREIARRGTR
jgi:hypothetical protein